MTRRSLSNLRSNEEQFLQDVWDWYEFQFALIDEEKGRTLNALAAGGMLARPLYFGKTREELDEEFDYQAEELGQVTKLGMLACTEAALRIDFIERVGNKKKDNISRRFRDVYRRRGIDKIRLEADILDTRKDRGPHAAKNAVAAFKGALILRHWLAHGRYWRPKLGRAEG